MRTTRWKKRRGDLCGLVTSVQKQSSPPTLPTSQAAGGVGCSQSEPGATAIMRVSHLRKPLFSLEDELSPSFSSDDLFSAGSAKTPPPPHPPSFFLQISVYLGHVVSIWTNQSSLSKECPPRPDMASQ